MAQNETNKQEMKQEKITPESIIKKRYPFYDENLEMKDVELNGGAVQALMEDYHLQSLQQLLDEASEELPDYQHYVKWRNKLKENNIIPTPIDIIIWMRTEAAKTVLKWKMDNKDLEECCDEYARTITQLKEELARKDEALAYCHKRIAEAYSELNKPKTDKP